MKTTLDLPDALVHEIQLKAEHRGQQLADTVTELLWKGLAASSNSAAVPTSATLKIHPQSSLPYIECAHPAPAADEMTPSRVAQLLIDQEAVWQHEAGR